MKWRWPWQPRAAKVPSVADVRPDYIVWDGNRRGWGMAVEWFWPDGKLALEVTILGFDPVRNPRVGDLFTLVMGSGKTTLWLVLESEGKSDPPDMYGAKLYGLGYQDEIQLPASSWVEPDFQLLRG